jgi:hypothetical protein
MLKPQTTIESRSQPPIPPMPLYRAALVFAATSLVFFLILYVLLPLLRRNNISWFVCFNLVLAVPMFLLVGCALLAYASEGNPLRWHDLRDRFRLRSMDLSSWLWTVGLAIFMFGGRFASLLAFASVLFALGLDRSLGWKQRIKVSLGVAAFLAFSWLIWQTRSFFSGSALAFVAQCRKNTWPGIIAHTVGNGGILIGIVHGIMS